MWREVCETTPTQKSQAEDGGDEEKKRWLKKLTQILQKYFLKCAQIHTHEICVMCVCDSIAKIQVASATATENQPLQNEKTTTTAKQMKSNNEMKIVLDFSALNSTMKQFV